MNYAIILAGGSGTRFWPLSREKEPKQFLKIFSDKPLIQETIKRLDKLIEKKNIYIATNKIHFDKIEILIRDLKVPLKNIFVEPKAKNTLAPVGILAFQIFRKDPDAVIIVSPSDHFIRNRLKFQGLLNEAMASARKGYILTLGIKPERPETGFGYIKINSKAKGKNSKALRVEKFVEKPRLFMAEKFIKDKRYYWNTGIFVFKAKVLLEEIKNFLPGTYALMEKISSKKKINKFWPRLPRISLDYAVMEKTNKIALIPADIGWRDLGSWLSLEEFMRKDKDSNVLQGNCVDLKSKNILVWSGNRLVATLGLKDLIIVDTKDALLVCAKDKHQDLKSLVELLKRKKKSCV